jgi:hypothetical protein
MPRGSSKLGSPSQALGAPSPAPLNENSTATPWLELTSSGSADPMRVQSELSKGTRIC